MIAPFLASFAVLVNALDWKIILIGAGVALGTFSFAAQAYSERAGTQRRRQLREQIEALIAEGNALQNRLVNCQPLPLAEAEDWARRAESLLHSMAPSCVIRFRDGLGGSPLSAPRGLEPERAVFWHGIRTRIHWVFAAVHCCGAFAADRDRPVLCGLSDQRHNLGTESSGDRLLPKRNMPRVASGRHHGHIDNRDTQ